MDQKISGWCFHQRTLYKHGALSKDKIEKLESIDGWQWTITSLNDLWFEKAHSLKTYIESGNPFPTDKHEIFGAWIRRIKYKRKKNINYLSKDKVKFLESIDGWYWYIDHEYNWWVKAKSLKSYMLGDVEFPKETHKEFGYWIHNMKRIKKIGTLPQDKIDFLESINGWYWVKNRG